MRKFVLLAGLVILAGCNSVERDAEKRVASELRDPSSAQFRNVRVVDQVDGSQAVCGEVNAKNAYGGYVGFEPFVHVLGVVHIGDDDVESIRAESRHCVMAGRTDEQFEAYIAQMNADTARIESALPE